MNAQQMFDRLQDMFPNQVVKVEITIRSTPTAPTYWLQVGEDMEVFATASTFEEAYSKLLERYIRDKRKANEK